MEELKKPDVDSVKQKNVSGEEYWSARDLAPLLGYTRWEHFEGAIQRALTACKIANIAPEHHFLLSSKMVSLGSGIQRELHDYTLSRFACCLIAQNGDPRKEEIAAAQTYIAISVCQNELRQTSKEQQERLVVRFRDTESYKAPGVAASVSGVDSAFFGLFMDAGSLGLHRHTLEALRELEDIPEGEDALDTMTRADLGAIEFRNVQIEEKLRRENISGNEEAARIRCFIGDEVRKAIEAIHALSPENFSSALSIRKMVEERRRMSSKRSRKAAEREFASYAQEGLFDSLEHTEEE